MKRISVVLNIENLNFKTHCRKIAVIDILSMLLI